MDNLKWYKHAYITRKKMCMSVQRNQRTAYQPPFLNAAQREFCREMKKHFIATKLI